MHAHAPDDDDHMDDEGHMYHMNEVRGNLDDLEHFDDEEDVVDPGDYRGNVCRFITQSPVRSSFFFFFFF